MFTSSSVRLARSGATERRLTGPTELVSVSERPFGRLRTGEPTSLQGNANDHERGYGMHTKQRRRWAALGAVFGAGVAAVVVAALGGVRRRSGDAAARWLRSTRARRRSAGRPRRAARSTATGAHWSNNPTDYNYYWLRCASTRTAAAAPTSTARQLARTYKLTSADVGNTVRFRTRATNGSGVDATPRPSRRR